MYDYLFYFLYTMVSDNNDNPKIFARINACVGIVVVFLSHFTALLLIFIKCLFLSGYLKPNTISISSGFWGIVILITLSILAFRYFNDYRINKVLAKYADSHPNAFYVLMIILLPLIVAIIFTCSFPVNN